MMHEANQPIIERTMNLPPTDRRLQWRVAIASLAALVWIVAIDTSLRNWHQYQSSPSSPETERSRLPTSNLRASPSRIEQYEQWRTKRKQIIYGRGLYQKGEWEEDDDDDANAPFHLEDDDATKSDNNVDPKSDSNSEAQADNDTANNQSNAENEGKTPIDSGKGNQEKEDTEGIIYSDSVGPKESDPLPPLHIKVVPPPPPPPMEKKKKNVKEGGKLYDNADSEEKDNIIDTTNSKSHNTINKLFHQNDNNEKDAQQQPQHLKLPKSASTPINNKSNNEEEDDTIFDDLLRGFGISSLFCFSLYILYKTCWYTCVRCGFFPDERVLEARWRRWQLKKKRAYSKSEVVNGSSLPLDTRKWGEWMAKRELVEDGGGDVIIDEFDYSGNINNLHHSQDHQGGVWDDEDISIAGGAIEFENVNGELEMGDMWGQKNKSKTSSSSEMILEFGEGIELEDKSHDSRMFDMDDGGLACEKEADKFFEGRTPKSNDEGKTAKKKKIKKEVVKAQGNGNNVESSGNESDAASSNKKDAPSSNKSDISDDSFFDALQPPSGGEAGNDPFLDCKSSDGNDDDDIDPPQDVVDLLGMESNNDNTNNANGKENRPRRRGRRGMAVDASGDDDALDKSMNGGFRSSMLLNGSDRGYDEETDLLGLRSDSPPPLDLEEIEKNLKKNMENATLY